MRIEILRMSGRVRRRNTPERANSKVEAQWEEMGMAGY